MNMAGDPHLELPRAKRKRLISRAVLPGLLTTAAPMVCPTCFGWTGRGTPAQRYGRSTETGRGAGPTAP